MAAKADCLLIDGTVWQDDELQAAGVGRNTGSDMGHLALGDEHGMMALLASLPAKRKILIHINNTNPILNEQSPQRQALTQQDRSELGRDGNHPSGYRMLITDTPSPQAFEEALRAKGAFYHIHHPYHIAMHNGDATREQIQGWVANRFYYQTTIPLKDAAIMANCPDAQTRRKWVQRILDHDGSHGEDGGIEAWLRLGKRSV